MSTEKTVSEVVEEFEEVSRILVEEKEVEGFGIMRTYTGGATEEQKNWLTQTLQAERTKRDEMVKQAITNTGEELQRLAGGASERGV